MGTCLPRRFCRMPRNDACYPKLGCSLEEEEEEEDNGGEEAEPALVMMLASTFVKVCTCSFPLFSIIIDTSLVVPDSICTYTCQLWH